MLDERWDQSCDWLNTNINENNEKIINNEHEISKLIKALPKDIAALDKSGKEHPTDDRRFQE